MNKGTGRSVSIESENEVEVLSKQEFPPETVFNLSTIASLEDDRRATSCILLAFEAAECILSCCVYANLTAKEQ